uniref:Uncharacterized protein n=1 Tax=Ulva partita TaxID=1605170 RepID=A0A1C9ZQJ7_9CHLO|nr:hypothetical protein [Ulva partita]
MLYMQQQQQLKEVTHERRELTARPPQVHSGLVHDAPNTSSNLPQAGRPTSVRGVNICLPRVPTGPNKQNAAGPPTPMPSAPSVPRFGPPAGNPAMRSLLAGDLNDMLIPEVNQAATDPTAAEQVHTSPGAKECNTDRDLAAPDADTELTSNTGRPGTAGPKRTRATLHLSQLNQGTSRPVRKTNRTTRAKLLPPNQMQDQQD